MSESNFELRHVKFEEYAALEREVMIVVSERLNKPRLECVDAFATPFREYVLAHPDLAERLQRDRAEVTQAIIEHLISTQLIPDPKKVRSLCP